MAKQTKLTLSSVASLGTAYVKAENQGNTTFTATYDNIQGAVDKIGKTVVIDQVYEDKLAHLDAEDLPLGKNVEEYFMDLGLGSIYGAGQSNPGVQDDTNAGVEGAKENIPYFPNFEDVAYSYKLGMWKISVARPLNYIQSGCNSEEAAGRVIADIVGGLQKSASMHRYAFKKQLLANAISKAITAGCVTELPKPVDTQTAEAFIKAVKDAVRDASFPNEGNCLAGSGICIGSAPELDLYVLKDVPSSLEVDAWAGAFQENRLALPATVRELDSFGDDESGTYALLVDPRGIKFYRTFLEVLSGVNKEGAWFKSVRHEDDTAFISLYTFIRVFKPKAE